ncbi:MAG: ABC transporter ATP-binding protein [Gammaproteobacteria bacterium]|nr:ABC transporter ATP-binding protein [Gammaproteobacteria bacterium]
MSNQQSSQLAVRCLNLCKTFTQGETRVVGLDDVSIDIAKGDMLCLSGPSGSGKTTLLNAIGALDTPDSGEVWIENKRIDQLSKGDRADLRMRHIGFVFQAFNLIPVLSAQENIEFVMELQGVAAAERHKMSSAILEQVGMGGLEHRRPAQLSGGQQQRVAVARAIVSRPSLVLADEPTANLDSQNALQLIELFTQLNTEMGITFVIATHDTRVMSYCRRLIRMVDGQVVSDEIRDTPSHPDAGKDPF